MKKHQIFSTYADTPIKNVKTPIRRFNGDPEDEDIMQTEVIPVYADADAATIQLLEHIRALLLVILILKIVCLWMKH